MDPKRWQQIQSLCEEVLKRETGQREAYLREACAGDKELRREVESFLSCGTGEQGFLEAPALQQAAERLAQDRMSGVEADLTGQTLLHYRLTEKIGAGGMGEVYRANDTHLQRDVAIKALPDLFAGDPERLARFEREARLLASLNHPNIAAIHGFEESCGHRFLVLELVEGPTLAERLRNGPLRVAEALRVCGQVAEGLEAAHDRGIVHRDLKPANVKVDGEGRVKILDFGLARALHEREETADPARSATIAEEMSRPGAILGTAAYMSPEQARGEAVDKRTDIWAFGCLLYECLTGNAPFKGNTTTETAARILEGVPDWDRLPVAVPRQARELLHRCLQKDRRERMHDIGDARIEIAEVLNLPVFAEVASARRYMNRWALAALIGGLIAGTALIVFVTWQLKPAPALPVARSLLRLEAGQRLEGMRYSGRPTRRAMAVSHDGRFIVYSAIGESPGPQAKAQIHLRRMDQMTATPVPGTEGGQSPILSPDDQWILFWEGGKLKKIRVAGGVPAALCEMKTGFGADWGPDNTIVFSDGQDSSLSRVAVEGGEPEVLTVLDKSKEERSHRLPRFLPNGKGLLFTVMRRGNFQHDLAFLDLKTREWRSVMENAADGHWVPTGHLVFLRQGTMMAVAFDLDRLAVHGQPMPVVANVMQALNARNSGFNTGEGQYSVSDSGWLVYAPGGIIPDRESSLVRVDQKGAVQPVVDFKAVFFGPRFSPDGQRITYWTLGKERRTWIYDLNRGTTSPLTVDGETWWPLWTPDGKRLVFGRYQSGSYNLYWQPIDHSSPMEQLTERDYASWPGSFTPDGSTLAFLELREETSYDILFLDMKSRRVTPFLNSKAHEGWPEFSPDGRWLAYCSNESGSYQIYVCPFPGSGGKWQISSADAEGWQPIWSKDGKQLFFEQNDLKWVVDIRTDGGFSAGKPRLMFKKPGLLGSDPIRSWDVWPDGNGFLAVKPEEIKSQAVTEMILVQNWFEELKHLCPAGK